MRFFFLIAAVAFAGEPLPPADQAKILRAENAILKFQNAAHEETLRYQREMARLMQMEQQARKEYDATVQATRPDDCADCKFNAAAMTWTAPPKTTTTPATTTTTPSSDAH